MTKPIVFAARDTDRYRSVVASLAIGHSEVVVTDNGCNCLDAVVLQPPHSVLVDIDLPGMPVFELLTHIRRFGGEHRPVVVVFGQQDEARLRTVTSHGLADGFIALPCGDAAFVARFADVLDARAEAANTRLNTIQRSLLKLGRQCMDAMGRALEAEEPINSATVDTFCQSLVAAARSEELVNTLDALRAHHSYSFVHVLRVASAMTVFGHHVGMRDGDLMRLAQAGLLHDVGKLCISQAILCKPGPLSEDEWVVVKEHPTVSVDILSRGNGFSKDTIDAAHNHHERIDGTGYPRGLKGGQIDDLSLVCAVADVFSALTEKRSYKPRLSHADALVIMRTMTGHHLEPSFFARFEEIVHASLIV